jgi:hypothetical protein
MSYDDDYYREEALFEEAVEAVYPEHFERAVIEFTTDRLQSFYLAHRDVALAPLSALSKARSLLLGSHLEAALVFAAVAVEVGLRAAILRPITYGLAHNEDLAAAVAEVLMKTRALVTLRTLSLRILAEHGGIDLDRDRRPRATRSLWGEMMWLQVERNKVLHDAVSVPSGNAEDAVAIATHFLEVVFPAVLRWLELTLDPGHLILRDPGRRFPEHNYRLDEAGRLYGRWAGGQYMLRDEGRIFEGSADTGFYVSGDHLYGPARQPLWLKACEELKARSHRAIATSQSCSWTAGRSD